MFDLFGFHGIQPDAAVADFLDHSAYDEKFEVDLAHDAIRNIHHVENKFLVPVLAGGYRDMYEYGCRSMACPDDTVFRDMMNPDTMADRLRSGMLPGVMRFECRLRLVDGSYRWVLYIGLTGVENGVPEGLVWFYVFDIQNQRDRINGQASAAHLIDSRNQLTGLLVGEAFLPAASALMNKQKGPWCCVAIDIQHFKVFNAWYTQEKGNYVLARIGALLTEFSQTNDAVAAYFGRDNFAVFTRHEPEQLKQLFGSITEVIHAYSKTPGFMPAMGIHLLEENARLDLEMYDKARIAVEEAKSGYTDRIRYFDTRAYVEKQREFALLSEFQTALRNGEISFYLQPQCHIPTGRIVGAEALVRWIKPDGTVLPPGAFVPYLERNGFISDLDKQVWEAVCSWLRDTLDKGVRPVPVSVNVSQVDLLSMDVAAYLYGLTERYSVPPRLIKVEITESAYAENFAVISQTVTRMKEKGFTVLMDDFGAGYSSLSMLEKINVDVIKLDMTFMRKDFTLGRKEISIVESIVSMTKTLGLPVVIEGVENEEQLAFLQDMGCQYAQGYYFYKPMSIAAFKTLTSHASLLDYEGFRARASDLFHSREFLNETLFPEAVLNNILGPVAFYCLEGNDLTITRFNEPFHRTIGDPGMDSRLTAIQNYVVQEDWPALYRALNDAQAHMAAGGSCEVRFFKSNNSVFWFRIRFFYLRQEGQRRHFYGQIEDVTEAREQSLQFFDVLRRQSAVTMRLNLDQGTIQYVTGSNTLIQRDLPSMPLRISVQRTLDSRVDSEDDKRAFSEFFSVDRLRAAHLKAVYHESLIIGFRLHTVCEPVLFSTYYIRHSKDQDLFVYAFARPVDPNDLEKPAPPVALPENMP